MQCRFSGQSGMTDFAMQHATAFETMRGNIAIIPAHDGITAEDRIAVMPFIVDRIFSICKFRPDRIGQKLILRVAGPVFETLCMPLVLADHFLQKDDIGIKRAQAVAQLMHHHPPVEMGKTLVNIVGGDMQLIDHG